LSKKRKRKWNRRIVIAKTLLELHLTYVKSKTKEVWFCMADIHDRWDAGIIPHGYKKSASMTDQELSNRLKSIWALDCVESEYREYNWGDERKRQVYFRVTSEEGLRKYISSAKAIRDAIP